MKFRNFIRQMCRVFPATDEWICVAPRWQVLLGLICLSSQVNVLALESIAIALSWRLLGERMDIMTVVAAAFWKTRPFGWMVFECFWSRLQVPSRSFKTPKSKDQVGCCLSCCLHPGPGTLRPCRPCHVSWRKPPPRWGVKAFGRVDGMIRVNKPWILNDTENIFVSPRVSFLPKGPTDPCYFRMKWPMWSLRQWERTCGSVMSSDFLNLELKNWCQTVTNDETWYKPHFVRLFLLPWNETLDVICPYTGERHLWRCFPVDVFQKWPLRRFPLFASCEEDGLPDQGRFWAAEIPSLQRSALEAAKWNRPYLGRSWRRLAMKEIQYDQTYQMYLRTLDMKEKEADTSTFFLIHTIFWRGRRSCWTGLAGSDERENILWIDPMRLPLLGNIQMEHEINTCHSISLVRTKPIPVGKDGKAMNEYEWCV